MLVDNMTVEELNEGQRNNLSILRERIAIYKKASEEIKLMDKKSPDYSVKLTLKDVPPLTEEVNKNGEFNLDRHYQLCGRVDALHWNYLVRLQQLEDAIKDLSVEYEELIGEGTRVRY